MNGSKTTVSDFFSMWKYFLEAYKAGSKLTHNVLIYL